MKRRVDLRKVIAQTGLCENDVEIVSCGREKAPDFRENVMGISVDVYGKMRVWENIRGFEIEERNRILSGKKLETDEWSMWATSEEEIEAEHRDQLTRSIDQAEEISKELSELGIDVEYVVTSFYTNLRRGFWLHNYYIEEVKQDNSGYIYQTYEHEKSSDYKREVYSDLKEAITNILSYYHYLSDNPKSADEVIRAKWDILV